MIPPSAMVPGKRFTLDLVNGAMMALLKPLRTYGYMDIDTWIMDATSVRTTRAASWGGKKWALKNR